MKKGLLSILAGALVVVGCQNYDDQFDSLESQINALASTVAGLSQVQSDLSSLAGTVNSLSSTVASLGSSIDTAVSNGLADITADIAALQSALGDVASSSDVSAISDAVAAAQEDLDDLLASSSVFTGDVVVNSSSTLSAYLAMGSALNIVNGNVNITVSTDMDQTKVQSLVDNILTVVKDLTYTSAASSIAETTFNNLTGVQSITIKQGGGIRFPNLISATNIDMKDDFESTVEVIHFGALTSVSSFKTDAVANKIEFTKAKELHLTSLVYYPGATLTIVTDEGAAMPFAMDDVDADGDTLEDGVTLNITGPASFSISNIADGSITLTDVATVNLTDFKGSVTISGDVESFTSNSLVSLTVSSGTKIETVDVTGVKDPDATTAAPSYGPTINLDTLGDLETVKIAGVVASVNLGSNNNLTDITISASVDGPITIDNNSDLTSVTLTGAKASSLDVDTNADLTSLTVDLTWQADVSASGKLDGDLDVTDNASLEKLTVSADNLENLTVTGNDALTTVDFTGVTKIGATGTADVDIWDNDLQATKIVDGDDGATNVADGKAGDLGTVTSVSGMSTLKTWLTAVAADADSAANVYWDKVESYTTEADVESTDIVYSTNTTQNATTILLLSANTAAAGKAATKQKRAFILKGGVAETFGVTVNSTELFLNAGVAGNITMDANTDLSISKILDAAHIARATAAGVTITAAKKGNATGKLAIWSTLDSARAETSAAVVTNTSVGSGTVITLTIGPNTVTTTIASSTGNADDIADRLITAFQTQTDVVEQVTLAKSSNDSSYAQIDITAKDKGSDGHGLAISLSVNNSKTVSTTTDGRGVLAYSVGDTRLTTDNETKGSDIVLTIEDNDAGTLLNSIGAQSAAWASATIYFSGGMIISPSFELHSTLLTVSSTHPGNTANNQYPTESRGDVRIAEDAVPAAASNAVSYNRVGWL